MRTMKILVAGWLGGATFVVLISATAETRSSRAERRTLPSPVAQPSDVAEKRGNVSVGSGRRSTGAATTTDEMVVPVLGVALSALRDNFEQIRGGGRQHNALDIMAPHGTPVIASVDGTIRKLFNSKAGGLTIYQFDRAEERVYYYAHLDRYADGVAEGLFVKRGSVIGYVGVTGNSAPDAPHLHFSVELLPVTKEWWKGSPVNPYPLLMQRASVVR